MFRTYSIQCLSSSMSYSCGTVLWGEVLHVAHAVDHFLRLLAEWVEPVILLQVGFQRLSIWMHLELMNQLLDCFLAGVILLLDC